MSEQRSEYQKQLKEQVTKLCSDIGVERKQVEAVYEFVREITLASYRNGQKARRRDTSTKGSALQNGKLRPVQ